MKNNLVHKTTLMKSLSLLQPKLPSIYTAKHGRNRAEKMRSREAERGMVQGEEEGGRAGVEWKWNMRERRGRRKIERGTFPLHICLFRNKSSLSHPISTETRTEAPRREIYTTSCCIKGKSMQISPDSMQGVVVILGEASRWNRQSAARKNGLD